jgi:hypothetical protein
MLKITSKFIILTSILFTIYIMSSVLTSCGLQELISDGEDFHTNASLSSNIVQLKYILEDEVKGVDSAIIDAAEQVINSRYSSEQYIDKFNSIYIDFIEVKETSNDNWKVRYRIKYKETDFYDLDTS